MHAFRGQLAERRQLHRHRRRTDDGDQLRREDNVFLDPSTDLRSRRTPRGTGNPTVHVSLSTNVNFSFMRVVSIDANAWGGPPRRSRLRPARSPASSRSPSRSAGSTRRRPARRSSSTMTRTAAKGHAARRATATTDRSRSMARARRTTPSPASHRLLPRHRARHDVHRLLGWSNGLRCCGLPRLAVHQNVAVVR